MEMPFGGTYAADTFETGTRAAAWGGTTTIVDFAIQSVGKSLREGLDAWYAKADGNCAIDYAFHMILADVNPSSLKEMDRLVSEGVTSFKLFMAYPGVFYSDDGQILRAMQQASGNGGLIMMHAENGIAIDVLVEQALAAGHTDPATTATSARSPWRPRPPTAQSSSPGSPDPPSTSSTSPPTRPWKRSPPPATRACPSSARPARSTCSCPPTTSPSPTSRAPSTSAPPRCAPSEHQETLWRGLRNNELQVVSTDHCPFCFSGQKEMGRGDFSKIPNGMPGVEHRMDLLHQAVVDGHITRRRWIEIACASRPACSASTPRRAPSPLGADADIVIYDPAAEQTLSAETHHMNVDYSAYEGKRITGQVETVLSRGEVVIDGRKFTGRAGHGIYTPRATCQYLD